MAKFLEFVHGMTAAEASAFVYLVFFIGFWLYCLGWEDGARCERKKGGG